MSSLQAQGASLPKRLQELLGPYGVNASLSVRDLQGTERLASQSQRSLQPASVAKLVSSACTFEELGPEFQFETHFAQTGKLSGGVLEGNLVVQASGDFSFVIEDLKMVVEAIRFVYGIREIRGNLIFDTSLFASPQWDQFDGFEGDEGRSFHARMTAAPINHNSFAVWVAPTTDAVQATVLPRESLGLQLINQLRLRPGRLGGSQTQLSYDIQKKQFVLAGAVGSEDEPRAFYRALPDPYETFARLFKFNFESLGGVWKGKFELSSQAVAAKRLWTHRSKPLSKLFMDINKLSTNFGSELSLMAAARTAKKARASVDLSKSFLTDCVKKFGFSATEIHLDNASGLSRESRMQTRALTKLLSSLSKTAFFPEYMASLSILGQDGTTRSRLKDQRGGGRLKTGSIKNVRTIAGYVRTKGGEWMSFALFLNCTSCDFGRWAQTENSVMRYLMEEFG